MRGMGQGARAVTVPATTAGNTATPITSPCRLAGWSLAPADIAGATKVGTQTAPAAGTTIASLGTLGPGEYTVNWIVQLGGTPGAGEVNNFALFVGATQVATSLNLGAVGTYSQEPVQIVVPAGGAAVTVQNLGVGTAGAVYSTTVTCTGNTFGECVILDGGQTLGVPTMQPGASDTQWLLDDGIYVGTSLAVKVTSGTVSGCLYVVDNTEDT